MNKVEIDINEILHNRAIQLAKLSDSTALVESSTILVFQLGEEQKYGIPYYPIQRVSKLERISPIPNLSTLFMGIVQLNSEAWPVVNAAELFDLSTKQSFTPEFLILMVKEDIQFALATSMVIGLVPFNKKAELSHFDHGEKTESSLIKGIYEQDISLIDIETTFNFIRNYTP